MKKNIFFSFLTAIILLVSVMNSVSAEESHSDTLVVFFSATGTTKNIAERIAAMTNADIYEIIPVQPYTDADLNWNDSKSRTSIETADAGCRPEIEGDPLDLEGYSTIYIGYPIWWGDIPRIMSTFVESYDFEEITMIPFCTSMSSGVGQSDKHLKEQAENGNWMKGTRFSSSISDADLQDWINNQK